MSKSKKKTKFAKKMAFTLQNKILHKETIADKPQNQFSLLKPLLSGAPNLSDDADQLAAITTLSKVPQLLHHLFGINHDPDDEQVVTSSRLPSRQQTAKASPNRTPKSGTNVRVNENSCKKTSMNLSVGEVGMKTLVSQEKRAALTVQLLVLDPINKSNKRRTSMASGVILPIQNANKNEAPGSFKKAAALRRIGGEIQKVVPLLIGENNNSTKGHRSSKGSTEKGSGIDNKLTKSNQNISFSSIGKENTRSYSAAAQNSNVERNVRSTDVNTMPGKVTILMKSKKTAVVSLLGPISIDAKSEEVKLRENGVSSSTELLKSQTKASEVNKVANFDVIPSSLATIPFENGYLLNDQHKNEGSITSSKFTQRTARFKAQDYVKLKTSPQSLSLGSSFSGSHNKRNSFQDEDQAEVTDCINTKAIIFAATRQAVFSAIEYFKLPGFNGAQNLVQDPEAKRLEKQTQDKEITRKIKDEVAEVNLLVAQSIEKTQKLTEENEKLNEENILLITNVCNEMMLLSEDIELQAAFREFSLTRSRRRVSKMLLVLFFKGIKHAIEQNAILHEEKNRKIKKLQEKNDDFKNQLDKLSKNSSYAAW